MRRNRFSSRNLRIARSTALSDFPMLAARSGMAKRGFSLSNIGMVQIQRELG